MCWLFISSYLLVMQVYLLLLLNHNLYSMVFLLVYSIVSSLLVVDLLVVYEDQSVYVVVMVR